MQHIEILSLSSLKKQILAANLKVYQMPMYVTTLTDNSASLQSHLELTVSLVKILLTRFQFIPNNCHDGIKRLSNNSKYDDIKGGNFNILASCLPAKLLVTALCTDMQLVASSDIRKKNSTPQFSKT